MERHLHVVHPVLDHGFVRVVDYMGDDAAIVQAARVSYGRGTKSVQNDEGLIRYLSATGTRRPSRCARSSST
jgi:thymidylate synthase (FAD)